jgi:HEAT repeat protein
VDRVHEPNLTPEDAAGAPSAAARSGLDSPEAQVRLDHIRQLRQRMDPQAISKLLPLLQDRDSEVRREAAQALDLYGWKPANDQDRAVRALALEQFDEVMTLGKAGLQPLAALQDDPVPGRRLAALEMMIQLNGAPPPEALEKALKDEEPAIRLVAVQAAANAGAAQALPWLVKMMGDTNLEVRATVLEALGRTHDPQAIPLLIGALADPAPELRQRAAEWLGQTSDDSALLPLVSALLAGQVPLSDATVSVLTRLLAAGEKSETASAVIRMIESACREGLPESRLTARELLKRLGRAPRYAPGELSRQQLTAVMALSGALQAPNRDLRQGAVEALGRLGDARAIAPLTTALQDPDEWVRRAAVYSLHALGWEPANPLNLARQAVILGRWEVACACGEAAVDPLLNALLSSDPDVQVGAIHCLGRIGSPRALEALSERLLAGTAAVRQTAAQALSTLGWKPPDASWAVRHALALRNWEEAARHGGSSVLLLMQTIKASQPGSEEEGRAMRALATVRDPQAADKLLAGARDGRVAEAVVQALQHLLGASASALDSSDLRALAELANVVQFQYGFDARYGTTVRTALREVETARLRELAQRELTRRGEPVAQS